MSTLLLTTIVFKDFIGDKSSDKGRLQNYAVPSGISKRIKPKFYRKIKN